MHTFVSIIKRLLEGLLKALVVRRKSMDTFVTYSFEVDGKMADTAKLIQRQFADILGDENFLELKCGIEMKKAS